MPDIMFTIKIQNDWHISHPTYKGRHNIIYGK